MPHAIKLIAVMFAGMTFASAASAQQPTLIRDVNIVDVVAGTIAQGQSTLIEDGVIAQIAPDLMASDAIDLFDADQQ